MKNFLVIIFFLSSGVNSVEALPINSNLELTGSIVDIKNNSLSGIANLGSCSGSVIQFIDQVDTEKAYLMTNGHCVGRFQPMGTAVFNKATNRSFRVYNNKGRVFQVNSKLLLYATMTGTDVAFYELEQTLGEIKRVARVFVVDNIPPVTGDQLTVTSGKWGTSWTCKLEETLFQLRESKWTWDESLALAAIIV